MRRSSSSPAGSTRGRGTISRVPLFARDDAPVLARLWYREDGSASALTRSLASAPDVMETLMPFFATIMGESSLDLAAKELVIVRVSQLNGCRYCLAAHRPAALDAGVPLEHVEALCDAAPLSALAARERAIVTWVDQVTLDAQGATDELVARTLEHVRHDQLIELTVLAGTITLLNQYCTAFDIPPPK
jgi:AhpD family alkylhydroperoxidase